MACDLSRVFVSFFSLLKHFLLHHWSTLRICLQRKNGLTRAIRDTLNDDTEQLNRTLDRRRR